MTQKISGTVVDVVGPAFTNHGDALMAHAIERRFGAKYEVYASGKTIDRGFAGRLAYAALRRAPGSLRWRQMPYMFSSATPKGIRFSQAPAYADIIVSIDCSGYQYGDPWKGLVKRNAWRHHHYHKVKRTGSPVIFLPQAFGPFDDPNVQQDVRAIIAHADLIYARDKYSYQYLKKIANSDAKVEYCPDITICIQPDENPSQRKWKESICIVPNMRMMDMTAPQISGRYIDYVNNCINFFISNGLRPVLVIHQRHDIELAEKIAEGFSGAVEIYSGSPLETKALLRQCYAVVSSRYHALVGALSQATPTVGTGWSHKYTGLFDDFGCPGYLLKDITDKQELERKLNCLISDSHRQSTIATLSESAEILTKKINAMWEAVDETISLSAKKRQPVS